MAENVGAPRLIAGSGRSGTTWMLDVLAQVNGMRPIFEPLNPTAVPAAASFANQYIDPDDEMPELKQFLDGTFNGEFHSLWTDYRIRPPMLKPHLSTFFSPGKLKKLYLEWRSAGKRYLHYGAMIDNAPVLVKIIRGNLMLGWLRRQYDARIVFVVRHPGAVIESRLRINGPAWDPEPVLASYRNRVLMGELADRYAALLGARLAPAETHTLIWCIENQFPMERAVADGYPVVFYEHLLADGRQQWQRIVDALAIERSPYGEKILSKPSQQSALGRLKRQKVKGSWIDRLTSSDGAAIQRILDATGVTAYHVSDPAPGIPGSVRLD